MNELTEINHVLNQRPSLTPFILQRIEELKALKALAAFYVDGGTVPDSFYPSSKSGLSTEDRKSVAINKLAIAFQFGISAGLTEADVIQGVYVVNNVPQVWGKTMAKMIRMNSSCKELVVDVEYDKDGTPTKATWTLVRNDSDKELKASFSKQQAVEAKLWGKWQANPAGSYTEDMLIWKALKRLRDRYIPEAASGFDLREDMEEVNEQKRNKIEKDKGLISQADIQATLLQIEQSYTLAPKEAKKSLEEVSKWVAEKNFPQVVSTNLQQAWNDVEERLSGQAGMEDADVVDELHLEDQLTEEEKDRYSKLVGLRDKGKHLDIIREIEKGAPLEDMSPNQKREALQTFKEKYDQWKEKKQ